MNKADISIIVPIYNAEKYLNKCIDSIINQTKKELEILLINDGSTDNSVQIALAEGARVIHVIEKGYGAALIGGCDSAKGKYVIMGDADDSYDL